jgi:uncharacterized membrane protein YidH (DUF202 family)
VQNRKAMDRISAVLIWACTLSLLLTPLLVLWTWLDFDRFAPAIAAASNINLQRETLGALNITLGFLLTMVPLSLLMLGVWRLRQLFTLYRAGSYFNQAAAGHLHGFAMMLFFSALVSPITQALTTVVLTMGNPPGQRSLSINIGSDDFNQLALAGVLIAIAWVLREGQRLAQENAEII